MGSVCITLLHIDFFPHIDSYIQVSMLRNSYGQKNQNVCLRGFIIMTKVYLRHYSSIVIGLTIFESWNC